MKPLITTQRFNQLRDDFITILTLCDNLEADQIEHILKELAQMHNRNGALRSVRLCEDESEN